MIAKQPPLEAVKFGKSLPSTGYRRCRAQGGSDCWLCHTVNAGNNKLKHYVRHREVFFVDRRASAGVAMTTVTKASVFEAKWAFHLFTSYCEFLIYTTPFNIVGTSFIIADARFNLLAIRRPTTIVNVHKAAANALK